MLASCVIALHCLVRVFERQFAYSIQGIENKMGGLHQCAVQCHRALSFKQASSHFQFGLAQSFNKVNPDNNSADHKNIRVNQFSTKLEFIGIYHQRLY